ncbi:tRNA(1)(Val) (adenine(37)-N(6))-methyltransferase [hydrothermal vent metagenome]|uniref:tRNA(1)(Val) (Adenine(37)-N(6))-methyltransferase n=1 Tax=hydrothermal vent metagenome TaxID=652676 RepID=A0A3B0RMX7_9ZZZZ
MTKGWPGSWSADQLSRDDFLGGRLKILQPRRGYRAGVDPVLLAASVPAVPGDSILDLGCGVGVASLCLGARVPDLVLSGLELQDNYADLARQNASANSQILDVTTGDVADMPLRLRQKSFTHVISNPPYFNRNSGSSAQDEGREAALGEDVPLAIWVKTAAKRAAPKGTVTFIHRAERAPDLIGEMARHLGSLELMPLIPRTGRTARLVLLRGRKGGRADFRLHDGLVMHAGVVHDGDRKNYAKATASVLWEGAPLIFPG